MIKVGALLGGKDRRRLVMRKLPDVDQRAQRVARNILRWELHMARLLAEVDDAAHYIAASCASVGEYGATLGLDPTRTRALAELGKAIQLDPRLEQRLLTGETDTARAALAARIMIRPGYVKPGEDWVEFARSESKRDLAARVNRRIEEMAQEGSGLRKMTFFLHKTTVREFQRCRQIASDKAGKRLTDGQVLDALTHHYLSHHDFFQKTPRRRRMPDTRVAADAGHRGRTIPAEVRRAVRERSKGRCEMDACDHELRLELAHLTPHAQGAGRETEDLAELCSKHHTMYDAGLIEFVGWTDENRPRFERRSLPEGRAPPERDSG